MRSWQLSREHPKAKSLKAQHGAFPLQTWQLGLAGRAEHSPWAPLAPSVPLSQWRPRQHFSELSNTKQCYQKPQAKQGVMIVARCEQLANAGELSSRLCQSR